jgi:NAD(P)-dependent dehydrogenase (short-subunit alcohol dehydrogenase family)
MVRSVDRSVGRVLQALREQGLEDNTIVIFTSDNGAPGYIGLPEVNKPFAAGSSPSSRAACGCPTWPSGRAIFRPARTTGAGVQHRHPADAGRRRRRPAAHRPRHRRRQPAALSGQGRGAQAARALFWRDGPYRTVQEQGWKLIVSERPAKDWLFNLNTDPTERTTWPPASRRQARTAQGLLDGASCRDARAAVAVVPRNAGAIDKTLDQKKSRRMNTRTGTTEADARRVIQTNVIGAIATVEAAAEHLVSRGAGQIVGISSLASLQAMPKQAAYCASKAAFSMYLDAARLELKRKNVAVTSILPGFVVTDIMPKIEKFPFAVPAAQAAREIVTLIEQRKPVGVVPAWPWKWLRPFFGHFPDSLWNKLA